MGGLGPITGQNDHFSQYAPEKITYVSDRYLGETSLYGFLNRQLESRKYKAIARQPIIYFASFQSINWTDFVNHFEGTIWFHCPDIIAAHNIAIFIDIDVTASSLIVDLFTTT